MFNSCLLPDYYTMTTITNTMTGHFALIRNMCGGDADLATEILKTQTETGVTQFHTCDECHRYCYTGGALYPDSYTCVDCDDENEDEDETDDEEEEEEEEHTETAAPLKTNFDFITAPKNDEGKYECERCQTEFNDPSEVCWAEVGDFAKEHGIPLCADCCEDQIENWSEINDVEEEEEEEEDVWTEAKKQME